jgi:6-phosphogluconate dehydrogenase
MVDGKRELGVIGLGRMGGGLALQALEKSWRVVGHSRKGVPEALARAGIVQASAISATRYRRRASFFSTFPRARRSTR